MRYPDLRLFVDQLKLGVAQVTPVKRQHRPRRKEAPRAGLLREVPNPEGDEGRQGSQDGERPAGDAGDVSRVRHEDEPHHEGKLSRYPPVG